jgi:hypothetical protein
MSAKTEKDNKAFQAYLDNIKAKTGKTPDDFHKLAQKAGIVKPGTKTGEVIAWLKSEFGLGHGHSMALVGFILRADEPEVSADDAIGTHFKGNKAAWRKPYDGLMAKVNKFGGDIEIGAGKTYITLVRGTKKFGIVQVTGDRLDIGIKRKGVAATERFEASGAWNAMVTHRVRISDAKQIDAEVVSWLKQAYEAAE